MRNSRLPGLIAVLLFASALLTPKHATADEASPVLSLYKGPKDSAQLKKLLSESKDPILAKLDAETKAALLNMKFEGGLPRGLDSSLPSIKKLIASNANEVMRAIFGCQTFVELHDKLPKFKRISQKEYNDMGLGEKNPAVKLSFCKNCDFIPRDEHNCCITGGTGGCYDAIILVGNQYYSVK